MFVVTFDKTDTLTGKIETHDVGFVYLDDAAEFVDALPFAHGVSNIHLSAPLVARN